MNFDVAILGAGPAGAMAANALRNSGLHVIVLDKADPPRFKACGGLMGLAVQRIIDFDFSDLIELKLSRIHHLNNFSDLHIENRRTNSLLLVDRARFDNGLLQHAVRHSDNSIRFHANFDCRDVCETEQSVELTSRSGEKLRCRYLLAADGASSRAARCVGLNTKRKMAAAIDAELRVDDHLYQKECGQLTFNFFCVPTGYGWIFPKAKNTLSCGIATWGKPHKLREQLKRFLQRSFSDEGILEADFHGYPIPAYSGQRTIATRRIALLGDAASLVDPIIGEGISYALACGKLAGETVKDLLNRVSPESHGLLAYQAKVRELLEPVLDTRNRFFSLPYSQAPEHYYRQVVKGLKGYGH
jgi:geranylgeranyl reductase family protein